jgi:hypothetical protein
LLPRLHMCCIAGCIGLFNLDVVGIASSRTDTVRGLRAHKYYVYMVAKHNLGYNLKPKQSPSISLFVHEKGHIKAARKC